MVILTDMETIKHIKWDRACRAFSRWADMNVSKSTQTTYLESLKKIVAYFKDVQEINDASIEAFKFDRHAHGDSHSTINGCLAVMGDLFKILKRMKAVEQVPEIKYLKIKNGKDRVLSREERELIVENAKNPLKLMVLIALTTGIRKEGVYNLKWSDLKQGLAMYGVIDIISKGGKRITVPIPKGVQMEIANWKAISPVGHQWSPYLFPSPYNKHKPRNRTGDAGLRDLLDSLGIKGVTFHTFRHTFASHFLRRTNNLKLLQEILGHSNISQTARYCHVDINDKQKAIQACEDDLTPGHGEDLPELDPSGELGELSNNSGTETTS